MTPRIAVVGNGYWGKNLVRNFSDLGALELVCDIREEALGMADENHPGIPCTTDFEEVLNDESIDGVVLATPAALHFEHARQALMAGKDVFVEKPLALEYFQGLELVELAEKMQAVLMVGHILEYHPAVSKLNEIVQAGDLGELWYVYSNRLNLGRVRQEENILWSFAPHDISVICRLVGSPPQLVRCSGGNYLQTGIADLTVTELEFEAGVRGHIFVSWLHPYKEQKLVVIGDKKMAVFNDTAENGKLRIYDKGIEWTNGIPVPRRTSETEIFIDGAEPMRLECQDFLACIETRARPVSDGRSALRVLSVLEAGQRSLMNNGSPIELEHANLETAA